MYCMRGYKYNYFTRRICNRSASLYCIFPCLASVGRNSGGQGLKWVSYSAKRKEISLNQRCERVVAYSEYSKAELVRNGFDANKIYIHVPIRCESVETPVSSFSDRNLLIYTGQIIRGKGVDVLLRSLEKISVPFECVILGEGNHRPYCERLCTSLGLDDRVKFAGFVPQDELKRFYAEASLCVMSSVWPEPFGMVGPEAMRYGLPVVAFDAGGIREWLTDRENGFLVPWMNTDLFAARVEELLQNKELARQMGQRGRVRVLREYEAARQVNGLEHMFESLVENACDQRAFVKLDARERGMSSAAVARVITTPGTENGDEVEGVLANERAELLPASETSISL
jgi:glycosyltransferase involved in cell wall biosynthesis